MRGGVAIYDVVKGTVTNVAEQTGFLFSSQIECVKSNKGKLAAVVYEGD